MRRVLWCCAGLLAVVAWGGRAQAGTDTTVPDGVPGDSVPAPTDTVPGTSTTLPGDLPPALGPLVVVPPGCAAPARALAVFTGTIRAVDDPERPTTVRFRINKLLAGSLQGFVAGTTVDVHYGEEARFLTMGTRYVVGAQVDPDTGLLVSTVRQNAPLFGGDAVIGINDSDVDCPRVEDPVRTLLADGSSVDTGVLAPLRGEGGSLLAAVLTPLIVALGVLVALVLLKLLLFAVGRSLRAMGDAEPAPAVERSRRHHREPSAAE